MDVVLRFCVAAYNLYFNEGFCSDTKEQERDSQCPFDALKLAASIDQYNKLKKSTWDEKERDYLLSSLDFTFTKTKLGYKALNDDGLNWSRVDSLFKYHSKKTVSLNNHWEETKDSVLFDIVRNGLEKVSRRPKLSDADQGFENANIVCPYAEFGKIKMVEEKEILGFINLKKLIDKYIDSPKWSTPLSIAVFGHPGSGKSFAVKEIINSINPGRKTDPLTFNLAQFSSVDQLTEAFHQVQDRALASKEVPLVIFDEFDSSFNGRLGWLKFFLAPMQDGLFRGKTGDYRVGRTIFLFSGGTSYTYEQFNEQKFYNRTGEKQDSSVTTREEVKLDDFIGRLRGYLNIFGINDENYQLPGPLVKLRRAILLRAQLEKLAEPIFRVGKEGKVANIQNEVIKAFLETKRYEHGVRSMEAVIQMSRWIGVGTDKQFVVASLPSSSQLKVHVDLESFLEPFKDIIHDSSSS